ncbi:MAG: TonB-dependent receptor [Tannerellaceae bacterium]|jgi:outer membrane receptor protein involved in Fe transport|nr:TonB-dependent receptor [Tannerellaceae bacterium]
MKQNNNNKPFIRCAGAVLALWSASIPEIQAVEPEDSIRKVLMEEVVVTSSLKERQTPRAARGAVSVVSPQSLHDYRVKGIKDLSALVPNLYIPDYGGKHTTAIYLRGVGARSSGESVGVYVDDIPQTEQSGFDFELNDLSRIEVLRGPQGALYGRNAMAGIVNIHTLSAFDFEGTRLGISLGNYAQSKLKASHYVLLGERLGLSLGGYYSRLGGFFTNAFTGEKADRETTLGGRLKLEWRPLRDFSATYALAADYVDQGAFPYGLYRADSGTIDPVQTGDSSTYQRQMRMHSLVMKYRRGNLLLSSATGYQILGDDLRMDQDFSPATLFTLQQRQNRRALTQEWLLGNPDATGSWQWLFGLYAFLTEVHTEAPVRFGEDGVQEVLQGVFDQLGKEYPRMPQLVVLGESLDIPGSFDTPSRGYAFFHQSTLGNLFLPGLSLTAGLRIAGERQSLHYRSRAKMRMGIASGHYVAELPGIPASVADERHQQDFAQWLPKLSLQYAWGKENSARISVAKGYKTGGYNLQMSAEVMRSLMQYDMMNRFVPALAVAPPSPGEQMAYLPEYSWNYEAGIRLAHAPRGLRGELTLFLTRRQDTQLTRFVESGAGRILSNAGASRSLGVETSLDARLTGGLAAELHYGYTHAVSTADGAFLPLVPSHTLQAGLRYGRGFRNALVEGLTASAHLRGLGPIRWTETGDIRQAFYLCVDARAGLRKGPVALEFWVRNLTDTAYAAFYFESFGRAFAQKGKPLNLGVDLSLTF